MNFSQWLRLAEEKKKQLKFKDPLARKRPLGLSFDDHATENFN